MLCHERFEPTKTDGPPTFAAMKQFQDPTRRPWPVSQRLPRSGSRAPSDSENQESSLWIEDIRFLREHATQLREPPRRLLQNSRVQHHWRSANPAGKGSAPYWQANHAEFATSSNSLVGISTKYRGLLLTAARMQFTPRSLRLSLAFCLSA